MSKGKLLWSPHQDISISKQHLRNPTAKQMTAITTSDDHEANQNKKNYF